MIVEDTLFQLGLKEFGIALSEKQREQFNLFYTLLIEKNKVMNLTAITEYPDVVCKHFLDSLSIVLWKKWNPSERVIDVGTGAGFPGIPLKIVFPELDIVLADSLMKRIQFLDECISQLGLTGIRTVHARAEDLGRNPAYREQFDICVSRAVANLSVLLEYCLPFVKIGGYFLAYKSNEIDEEVDNSLDAIKTIGGKISGIKSIEIFENMSRKIIVVEKITQTPAEYPRKFSKIKQEPSPN
jgi:16S rRNA (guanine527-N7)-methyltransferase